MIELAMLIAFCSLFMTPLDDHVTWLFILDKAIQITLFVLLGKTYDKVKATK